MRTYKHVEHSLRNALCVHYTQPAHERNEGTYTYTHAHQYTASNLHIS